MLKTILLGSILLLTSGIAISQINLGRTVIDSSILEHIGDTVYIYEPGYIVKIGQRLMTLEGAEAELHAYKTLYSHCDSLRRAKDSTHMASEAVFFGYENLIEEKDNTINILTGMVESRDQDNYILSEMYLTEKRQKRRGKFIYGSIGAGGGLLVGLITGLVLR